MYDVFFTIPQVIAACKNPYLLDAHIHDICHCLY
jgi:hypothetical protein